MKMKARQCFDEILIKYAEWTAEDKEAEAPTAEDLANVTNIIIGNLKHATKLKQDYTAILQGKDSGREVDINFKPGYDDICKVEAFGKEYYFPDGVTKKLDGTSVEYESEHHEGGGRWARVYLVSGDAHYLAVRVLGACIQTAEEALLDLSEDIVIEE